MDRKLFELTIDWKMRMSFPLCSAPQIIRIYCDSLVWEIWGYVKMASSKPCAPIQNFKFPQFPRKFLNPRELIKKIKKIFKFEFSQLNFSHPTTKKMWKISRNEFFNLADENELWMDLLLNQVEIIRIFINFSLNGKAFFSWIMEKDNDENSFIFH